jgi:oligoendopeptidase F
LKAIREEIGDPALAADQRIKAHLLSSSPAPRPGFKIPMRDMRVDAALFRQENLELLTKEQKLVNANNRIVGAQTADWEGEEVTLYELEARLEDADRATRERAWRLRVERQLVGQEAIDALWADLADLRHQMARNAGFADYRTFRWQQLHRFDYTPEDWGRFHRAIEAVAVPAVGRVYERYQRGVGVTTLRPWDLEVDPLGRPPLEPFSDAGELEQQAAAVFRRSRCPSQRCQGRRRRTCSRGTWRSSWWWRTRQLRDARWPLR